MPNGSPHILVVDDDRRLVGLLERSLRFEGFDVTCAHSGEAALAVLREREPDLVLLDIGMPEHDGIAVLRETRQVSDVAVVMLTARDEVHDKVGALDLGADDYVAKPFDFDELVARIRAVLRRRGRPALDRLSYADVRLDLGRREADRGGRALALTGTEFDVLAHLLRYPRQVHSRQALHRVVWGYDSVSDSNVIDVHVGHLRRKLGDPPLIHTVRGFGFTLRTQP
jgi:two-component system, OmpR family, response regulator MprA